MTEPTLAKILIVDDHDDNLFVMKHCLKGLAAEIHSAKSGLKAIEAAETSEFALIFMDVQMPNMDGYETTLRVHQTEKNKNTPIIFITSISREEDHIKKGYETGAIDFMFKPFIVEEVRGKAKIFLDIYQRQEELKRLRQRAEQANRDKSTFMATISHEIRTPMNGVIGMNQLLLGSPLNEEQKDYTKTAIDSATSLLRLIDNILDYSKIEAGKLELETIPFNLKELLDKTLSMLSSIAKNKGIELRLEMAPDLPDLVRSDPLRVRQVITNLANNSIKFTETGHVLIQVSQAPACSGLHVLIEDTGIGIKEENINRLFGHYSQTDASISRRFGGTGLGLMISQCIVEAFGGHIEVTSQFGKGSQFFFDLPNCLLDQQETQTFHATQQEKQLEEKLKPQHDDPLDLWKQKPIAILLVDDNLINQKVASKLLAKMGFPCDIANNGQEAIDAVQAKDYDLVLMDCQMPILDGYEATKAIRKFKTRAELSIIAMTANVMKEEREACYQSGMNGFISKPVSLKELENVIRSAVTETHGPEELKS
jgi:signal transduction histidine kinase